ncbi:MAG: isocitrate/isopropylmalate dehydrogenase family protein [bacterium]|nr:isocitrate/isopropylmalate dehydrogenase family protein [bacterium]
MTTTITLIEGDGIGPEVTSAAVRVLEATGIDFEWEPHVAGLNAMDKHGEPLPEELIASVLRNRVALKGPVTTPVGHGFQSVNVQIRKRLDLFAALRPIQTLPALPGHFGNVDLVVVRENTEGLYSGLEHEVVSGVVESLKIITRKASTRIARFAFEHARTHGRKRITAVHKANIMKQSDGLFLRCFREIAEEYPEIEAEDRIVDNMAMQVVVNPLKYDVLVLPNLYGDILSDLCAGLVGGLGVVPGANHGENIAVFEAVHGSAPDIAGRNLANPTALIRSGVLMLEHLGLTDEALRVRTALDCVMSERSLRTRDLGGEASTSGFADALVTEIEASG